MTPAARLSAIISILAEAEAKNRPLDRAAEQFFRHNRFAGSHDRRFIAQSVYAIVRHHNRLNWWLTRKPLLGVLPDARLRAYAAMLILHQWNPAQLRQALTAEKYAPAPLTASEADALEHIADKWGGDINEASMDDATRYECPAWMLEKIKAIYGDAWRAELDAGLTEAPVDLRVNTLKSDRAAVLKSLPQDWQAKPTPYSPYGIRLDKRQNLGGLPELKSGEIEVQDEGSQILSLLCDARPGMQVLDFCAGAGGKSLAMAAQMQNKGRLTACDNHSARLKKSVERFRRAGMHNHELKLLDDAGLQWLKRQKERFDRVLCDVPCSGTGTWRRNPDMRHKLTEQDVAELQSVQRDILTQTAPLVKKGGLLIYATCSILREENENQIDWFLSQNPDFTAAPLPLSTPVPLQSIDPVFAGEMGPIPSFLRLSTARHHTDGFFMAILQRRS